MTARAAASAMSRLPRDQRRSTCEPVIIPPNIRIRAEPLVFGCPNAHDFSRRLSSDDDRCKASFRGNGRMMNACQLIYQPRTERDAARATTVLAVVDARSPDRLGTPPPRMKNSRLGGVDRRPGSADRAEAVFAQKGDGLPSDVLRLGVAGIQAGLLRPPPRRRIVSEEPYSAEQLRLSQSISELMAPAVSSVLIRSPSPEHRPLVQAA